MKFRGVIVPAATPLGEDKGLDDAGLARLVQFLLEHGVDALFANGSMGAFALLPDRVQYQTVEETARIVARRVPVLAGASDSGTARVIARMREMSRCGADAFVVLPPYFYLLNQREMLRFYLAVADASPHPVLLYENPRLTKNSIAPDTVAELAAHPNIAGMKVSNPDVLYWQDLLRLDVDRSRFSFISGAGKLTSLALQLGFDGITEGLHNIIPDVAVALFRAASAGNLDEAERLQRKINRCFRFFEIDGGWRGLEVALQYMGIATRAAPEPYDLPISTGIREQLVRVLTEEGVLRPYAQPELVTRE